MVQDSQLNFDWIIVGAGFSATAIVYYLSQQNFKTAKRALILEAKFEPARGLAYSAPSAAHLLNVPVRGMSIDCNQELHFLEWCKKSGYTFEANNFAPRQIYGAYLQDCLMQAQSKNSNLHVELANGCVTNVFKSEDGCTSIKLADGKTFTTQAVVIAIGNSPASPDGERTLLKTPWEKDDLMQASKLEEVTIIGTSLTAVDTVLALENLQFKGRYTLLSRRGLLPKAHNLESLAVRPEIQQRLKAVLTTGALSERSANFRKLIKEGQDWQSLFNALRPFTSDIWQSLNLKSKQSFLRHLRPYWDAHRHRIPNESLESILQLQSQGHLRLIAGRIQEINNKNAKIEISVKRRKSSQTIEADAAFDCRGIWGNVTRHPSLLIQNLLTSGLAVSDPLGLGFCTAKDGALVSRTGQSNNNIFTLGTFRRGELWETTAVREVREQAYQIAQCLKEI